MFQKFPGFKLAHKVPISKSGANLLLFFEICKKNAHKGTFFLIGRPMGYNLDR